MTFARYAAYLKQRQELAQHLLKLGVAAPRVLPDERLGLLLARWQGAGAPGGEAGLAAALPMYMASLPGGAGFVLSLEQEDVFAGLDCVFAGLNARDELAPAMAEALAPLRVVLARLALAGADPFAQGAEPGRALLEFCLRVGRGWDELAGRRADELKQRLGQCALALALKPELAEADCAAALGELAQYLAEFNRAVAALEQRLVSMERAQVRQQDARLYVAQLVGGALAGRALPESLLLFLSEVWGKYLHTVFLRDGLDSEAWLSAVAEVGKLADMVDESVAEEQRREYAARSFTVLGRVREAVESIHHNPSVVARCFEDMEGLVLARMAGAEHGLALSAAPDECLEAAPPPVGLAVDGDALRRVRALRVGDWLSISLGGQRLRAKLADKDAAHGQLFLVNYSGLKVGKREFAELAAEFERGEAWLLARLPVFETRAAAVEEGCQARLNAAKRELIQALRLREQERAKAMAEELAAEERRQAEVRAEAEAEARALASARARERAYQDSLAEVQALQAGAWVELPDASGKRVQAKLALIMASTRKLVFVDRRGLRLAEITQEALARLLTEDGAAVLQAGVAFESTLATLVQQRRDHLSEKQP
ncbi:MAG: DUF1631 family protein [Gammaproteobacteria bacterium]|nr:DUF1631 family protein [Gammaproteobacteria bacterium]